MDGEPATCADCGRARRLASGGRCTACYRRHRVAALAAAGVRCAECGAARPAYFVRTGGAHRCAGCYRRSAEHGRRGRPAAGAPRGAVGACAGCGAERRMHARGRCAACCRKERARSLAARGVRCADCDREDAPRYVRIGGAHRCQACYYRRRRRAEARPAE